MVDIKIVHRGVGGTNQALQFLSVPLFVIYIVALLGLA